MTDPRAQLRRTPLTGVHERLGATLTGFAGWLMPLRYGSETAEHNAVRKAAGLFDLSHMGEITVTGPDAAAALDYALVGQPSALAPGRARYTMICAPDGGVLDDLIVYRLSGTEFLVVANAANAEVVLRELTGRAGSGAEVTDRTDDYALIALQGPNAAGILAPLTDADLAAVKYYASYPATVAGRGLLLARTGYTGEDGYEIYVAPAEGPRLWQEILDAGREFGIQPCGLGARNTLRLEAKMALYGHEIHASITPWEADLAWMVKLDKGDFVGRAALVKQKEQGIRRKLIGFEMCGRGIARDGYEVQVDGVPAGWVTSGSPAPFLNKNIGLCYLPVAQATIGRAIEIVIRNQPVAAVTVDTPFYKRAK